MRSKLLEFADMVGWFWSRLSAVVVGLVCAAALCSGQPVLAQAPPAKPETDPLERLIYLPYKDLQAVFENEKSTVFLPYQQFLKLWEAYKPATGETPPPTGAVITSAAYVGKIEKDLATIEAQLTVQVLGKPWVQLPIEFGDAAVGKITSPDNKVLLQATGNGTYALLFPTAGEHKLQLSLSAKVRTSPDGKSLEMDIPSSGVTTFDLTVPAADQTVELVPQRAVTPVEGDAKLTHVVANLGASKKISARWHPRISSAPTMESLASVQSVLDVRVGDGLVHTQAQFNYQVQRGQFDQLRLVAPLGHRILDVTSPALKSWKATAEEKQQLIVIDLLSSDTKSIAVQVLTESPLPEEAFDLAGVKEDGTPSNVHTTGPVRENGLVVLSGASDLTLAIEKQAGVVRVEAGEAPEALRRPTGLYFKFYNPKFELRGLATPVEPRLLVEHLTQLTRNEDEIRLVSSLTYNIERAGVFELRFKLPESLIVDRVDCEPMKEFQTPDGQNLLIVLLKEKTQATVSVRVQGHLPVDPTVQEAAPLPIIEPEAVTRETGRIQLFAPPSLEVVTDEKNLTGAIPERGSAAVPQQVKGNETLAAAWSYSRRPVTIPVSVSRKPTRLSATVGTVINVQQDLVEVETKLVYQVDYAGLDTFTFAVPKEAAETVQIESLDPANITIKQKSKADPDASGWVPWTVVLQREATGPVPLRIHYDLKPERKASVSQFDINPVRVLSSTGPAGDVAVTGLRGELTLQKDRALAVTAVAKDFEAIDVRDLTLVAQDGYLAFRYFRQPEQLDQPLKASLTSTLQEIQGVVETVVSKALLEAVITEDPVVSYRCRYLVRTSERQRIPLFLPKNSELLDTLVAGRKVDLERNAGADTEEWDGYYVNLARTTRSDEPFVMSLVFRSPYREKLLQGTTGGQLKVILPQLGAIQDGDKSAVPVMEQRVALWVPRKFALVGNVENFTNEFEPVISVFRGAIGYRGSISNLENWFGQAPAGLFDFSTQGNVYQYRRLGSARTIEVAYWPILTYTWVLSGMVAVVGLILALSSWENRLTIVLIAAFVAVLWGVRDYDQTMHLLAAARWGLLAVLAIWIVRQLTESRKTLLVATKPVVVTTPVVTVPPSPPTEELKS